MKFGIKLLLISLFSFLMIDMGLNFLIPDGQNGIFELTVGFGAAVLGVFLIIQKITRIGSGLKQVSSELTVGIHFVLPLMLFVFGICFISEVIESSIKRDYKSFFEGLLILSMIYVLLHLVFKYSFKVMEVRYSDKEVVVSNFRKSEKVALDQIDDVYCVFFCLQCVAFKRDTKFGRKIYFLSSIYETLASVRREPSLLKDLKRQIYRSRKDVCNRN